MSSQPRILTEDQIDEKLDAAIRKNLALCFPHNKAVFSQTRRWQGVTPAYSVIVEDYDNVIAYTSIIDRTIKVGDEDCRIAGAQNVFVIPQYRGMGFSEVVLNAAMDEAKRQDFDFGLLFTRKNIKNVYARSGWIQITGRKFIRIENDIESDLPQESIKMYYPLLKKDFPPGIVHLHGNKW